MTEKITRLINPDTGELQCKICGTIFFSEVKPLVGEVYYNNEYICPNGCTGNDEPAGRGPEWQTSHRHP